MLKLKVSHRWNSHSTISKPFVVVIDITTSNTISMVKFYVRLISMPKGKIKAGRSQVGCFPSSSNSPPFMEKMYGRLNDVAYRHF